jgi:hypothetical protein
VETGLAFEYYANPVNTWHWPVNTANTGLHAVKDNKHENAMKQFEDKGCYPPCGSRTISTTLTGEMLSGSCANTQG